MQIKKKEVQGHPYLQSVFKVSLGYIRAYLKEGGKERGKEARVSKRREIMDHPPFLSLPPSPRLLPHVLLSAGHPFLLPNKEHPFLTAVALLSSVLDHRGKYTIYL